MHTANTDHRRGPATAIAVVSVLASLVLTLLAATVTLVAYGLDPCGGGGFEGRCDGGDATWGATALVAVAAVALSWVATAWVLRARGSAHITTATRGLVGIGVPVMAGLLGALVVSLVVP